MSEKKIREGVVAARCDGSIFITSKLTDSRFVRRVLAERAVTEHPEDGTQTHACVDMATGRAFEVRGKPEALAQFSGVHLREADSVNVDWRGPVAKDIALACPVLFRPEATQEPARYTREEIKQAILEEMIPSSGIAAITDAVEEACDAIDAQRGEGEG